MNGIIGFNFEDKVLAQRMCDIIAHLSPEGMWFYTHANITLGHWHLSIIDLKTKDQTI